MRPRGLRSGTPRTGFRRDTAGGSVTVFRREEAGPGAPAGRSEPFRGRGFVPCEAPPPPLALPSRPEAAGGQASSARGCRLPAAGRGLPAGCARGATSPSRLRPRERTPDPEHVVRRFGTWTTARRPGALPTYCCRLSGVPRLPCKNALDVEELCDAADRARGPRLECKCTAPASSPGPARPAHVDGSQDLAVKKTKTKYWVSLQASKPRLDRGSWGCRLGCWLRLITHHHRVPPTLRCRRDPSSPPMRQLGVAAWV